MKRTILCITLLLSLLLSSMTVQGQETMLFTDVPVDSYAFDNIHELRALGVINGMEGNRFGYDQTLTRAQFIVFLGRLNQWTLISPETPSFTDNTSKDSWYYSYIETALAKGVIKDDEDTFRPGDMITREEMGIMIISSMGYDWLAEERSGIESPFTDVTDHVGYIAMLGDFGIVNGKGQGIFDPQGQAKRQEAAVILMRMHKRLTAKVEEKNAFYAIESYPQLSLVEDFDTISFGWAELEEVSDKAVLKLYYPEDHQLPINKAKALDKEIYLSIFADDYTHVLGPGGSIITRLMNDQDNQATLIEAIIETIEGSVEFDGVTIDFESLVNTNTDKFASFIEKLAVRLETEDKKLMVMVHPDDNFDGYDYGRIAKASDRMILMAHDYNANTMSLEDRQIGYTLTPVSPLYEVYNAMKVIKDQVDPGDLDKVSLQLSFGVAQWVLDQEGTVTNSKVYTPRYDALYDRLIKSDTKIDYGIKSRNPYASYEDADKGISSVIWYEDERSIKEKMDLAKMFGIEDISVWRLGNIPDYEDPVDKEVYMDLMPVLRGE